MDGVPGAEPRMVMIMVQGIATGGVSAALPAPAIPRIPELRTMSVRTRPIVPDQLRDTGAVLDSVRDAQAKQRAAQTPVGTLVNLNEGRVAEWLTVTAKLMQSGRDSLRAATAQPLRTAVLPNLDPVDFHPRDRLAGRPPRL